MARYMYLKDDNDMFLGNNAMGNDMSQKAASRIANENDYTSDCMYTVER